MSKREEFRKVQTALGVPATGIPNDATKHAFQRIWDDALEEYRRGDEPAEPKDEAPVVIGEDHWLPHEVAKRELIAGGNPLVPLILVIHFRAGATGRSSIDYWRKLNSGICAHLVIERDGQIIQCRAFNKTCGHAGVSRWKGRGGVNTFGIGIELANAGNDDGALSWARRQPGFASIAAKHRNGGPMVEWEKFSQAQIDACMAVSSALVDRYGLQDVTGHDCIAPERKTDPGPAFPMPELREACGFGRTLPVVYRA